MTKTKIQLPKLSVSMKLDQCKAGNWYLSKDGVLCYYSSIDGGVYHLTENGIARDIRPNKEMEIIAQVAEINIAVSKTDLIFDRELCKMR
jgi:hypothetical protein